MDRRQNGLTRESSNGGPSDHRPLYVDFDVASLFGHPIICTERAALWDLQLDNLWLI
jgi:hypothetical protein